MSYLTPASLEGNIVNVSANYAPVTNDAYVFVTTGAGGVTVGLPFASAGQRVLTVKKVDAGAGGVRIEANGSDTIDGAGFYTINSTLVSITIISVPSLNCWFII